MNEIFALVRASSERVGFLSSEEERKLIISAQKDGVESEMAKNKLFCANSRFILKQALALAKRYGISQEMAFSACCEGFSKAISKFDTKKECRLVTYMTWWFQHYCEDELYHSFSIKLPHEKTGDEDLRALYRVFSLNARIDPNDDESNYKLELVSDSQKDPQDCFLEEERNASLENAIRNCLTFREAQIIRMYYGFDGEEEKSLREIGDLLGLSKQRTGQIRLQALEKLRNYENLASFAAQDADVA